MEGGWALKTTPSFSGREPAQLQIISGQLSTIDSSSFGTNCNGGSLIPAFSLYRGIGGTLRTKLGYHWIIPIWASNWKWRRTEETFPTLCIIVDSFFQLLIASSRLKYSYVCQPVTSTVNHKEELRVWLIAKSYFCFQGVEYFIWICFSSRISDSKCIVVVLLLEITRILWHIFLHSS